MRSFRIIVATILSTVIHFFVFTLLDTVPLISKEISPRPNLYMVDLVELAEERPAPQREEKPAVQQKVEEAKKEEPKKETVKQEKKKDIVVMEDRSKDKATKENKKKPTVNDEQQRLAAIKEIERKVAGREAQVSAAEIQHYPVMVENRVKGLWVIPDQLSARGLKAVVGFYINKNGEVINLSIKQSSGNLSFDQSVIRAIRGAVPFSPPPQVLLGEEYELTFEPKL